MTQVRKTKKVYHREDIDMEPAVIFIKKRSSLSERDEKSCNIKIVVKYEKEWLSTSSPISKLDNNKILSSKSVVRLIRDSLLLINDKNLIMNSNRYIEKSKIIFVASKDEIKDLKYENLNKYAHLKLTINSAMTEK